LSAARAASVVHLFSRASVDPGRLAAVGYGEFHPVGDNATVEGRNANRRVVLVILAAPGTRRLNEFAGQEPGTTTGGEAPALDTPAAAPITPIGPVIQPPPIAMPRVEANS
jgi:chemotaxis protein MotB